MANKTPNNHLYLLEFSLPLWTRFDDETREQGLVKADVIRKLVRKWLLEQGKTHGKE